MPATLNSTVNLLVRMRAEAELTEWQAQNARVIAANGVRARKNLAQARKNLAQAINNLVAVADRVGLGATPEILDWRRQSETLSSEAESEDTQEIHLAPDQMRLPPSRVISESQISFRNLLPVGVDPSNYPWLPTDRSMFPRFETDKVYMNGKVYSQAYGQLLFELPPENHYQTQTLDESDSDQWRQRVASGQGTPADSYVQTYNDGTTSDNDCNADRAPGLINY
ncbi:hypothetical protein FRC12_018731 [Ceratobasidium sp. 428]|nr:hypothetical protein FRC12_018731 [Ceratobasidium sp. 428]